MGKRLRRNATTGLPEIDDGREFRQLGALPPTRAHRFTNFEASYPSLPESEWKECSIRKWWDQPIYNQGQHGSCVGQASTTGFTYAWRISRQTPQIFSPTYVYAQINGNRDQGAQVSEGLECLEDIGTCLFSQVGQDKIYRSQISSAANETAKRFRVATAYAINSWVELGSAILQGMVVVTGIAVGTNFSYLDSNGVAPLVDRLAGGHALAHVGLKNINGTWVIETQNSWGADWGLNGYCYLREEHFDPRYGFSFDAFAIASVKDDPEDTETDSPILKRSK
jgi:C1A family cysteine protease